MKHFFALLLTAAAFSSHAQDFSSNGRIRAGVAYVHDFPGMNGKAGFVDYAFGLSDALQGTIAFRHIETSGFPRTATVREYTKANSLDMGLQYAIVRTENAALRIGAGYTFSFYNIRRSNPVYTSHTGQASDITYPVADSKGRSSGMSLTAEYEYHINEHIAAGLKVSLCKAYDNVLMGGPFIGVNF
jgi:hypothetical protein